jgi:hypothetical protein
MPRLSIGLGVQNTRKVGGRTIFRILISGAGTTTSNGEYVWDGVTITSGKPQYDNPNGSQIFWLLGEDQWILYDGIEGNDTYSSTDLITWSALGGSSPAPSATLYYTP